MTPDGDGRSDEAGERTGPAEPAPDAGETRYRTGEGGATADEGTLAEIAEDEPEPEDRLLDRVPENVV